MSTRSEGSSELGQKSALMAAAIQRAPDGIGVLESGRLVLANRALLRLFGEHPEQSDYGALGSRISGLLASAARGPGARERSARVSLDSDAGPTSVDLTIVELGTAGHDAFGLFARAAAEDPRLEERGAETERLIALGQLAAGVAHDINNPLAYVIGSIELAERVLRERLVLGDMDENEASILEAIANAREGAERVRTIVRDLVAFAFSRPVAERRELVDVEAALDSSVSLAWNEVRHRGRVVKRFGRVPRVLADASRLAQVFLNLLVNAAQSINEAARSDAEIVLSTRVEDGRVIVEVNDTGAGFSDAALPLVFEPLSALRPGGSGSALGLSICQRIVSSYGGEIGVASRLGEGTTFRLSFPLVREPARPSEAPETAAPPPTRGRARILVIDDEPLLGQTLKFAFCGRHDVVVIASGRKAIEQLASDSRYDLVLCDLMMPDVPGQKVFEAVERDHPELLPRFMFMTGGAFTESAQDFLERHPERRIDKPFTIADIEQLLTRLG